MEPSKVLARLRANFSAVIFLYLVAVTRAHPDQVFIQGDIKLLLRLMAVEPKPSVSDFRYDRLTKAEKYARFVVLWWIEARCDCIISVDQPFLLN